MDLDLVFLGTAASAPTAARGTSSMLLRRGGDRLLVDCGEGTQRQLLRSDTGLVDLEDVFLTHLHADHVLGLPGMLKTFALRGREIPIRVHGPRGTRALLGALGVVIGRLTYPLEVVELGAGEPVARDGYVIEPFPVAHGVGALGYALREEERPGRFDVEAADALGVPNGPARGALQRGEPVTLEDGSVVRPDQVVGPGRRGRNLVLTGDTAPSASVTEAAAGADVLVHEATFLADERARARETEHSTAAEAALVAREAGVSLLALTHVSARYPASEIVDEARQVFPQTVVPRDFDLIAVPFPERGSPGLVPRGGRRGRPPEDVGSEA
ncbi:MAG TPA: ribonuclease Z [Gaiella sp.]|nr:ribonuclease Z [Gaiella sp.]